MSEQEILWKQVFPNALLPLITLLGLSLGNLLGGTAVVEVIFTYPGLGNLAVQAITAYDYSILLTQRFSPVWYIYLPLQMPVLSQVK